MIHRIISLWKQDSWWRISIYGLFLCLGILAFVGYPPPPPWSKPPAPSAPRNGSPADAAKPTPSQGTALGGPAAGTGTGTGHQVSNGSHAMTIEPLKDDVSQALGATGRQSGMVSMPHGAIIAPLKDDE